MRKRLGNLDLESKIESFDFLLQEGHLTQQEYDESVAKLKKEYEQSTTTSEKEYGDSNNNTEDNTTRSKAKSKKEKSKKTTISKNQNNDNASCDDLQTEVDRLRKQLSERKGVNNKQKSKRIAKIKAILTRQEKTKKKASSKKANTEKANTKKATSEKQETQAQTKAKVVKEKETTKKESAKKGIKVVEGEAVRQFSVIRSYAVRFKNLMGKNLQADDTEILNFYKKIKNDNVSGRFSKKSPQFSIAEKIYLYLGNYKSGTFGDGMAQADVDLIKEVAKSEYLPLTIQYIKKYINLSANKNATKEKQDGLLKLMNGAKKRGAIKTTDISYTQFEKYRKNLESGKLEFDEQLRGFIGKLSGFVSGLQGLGMIDDEYSQKKKDDTEDVDYNEAPPSVMTTSEMLARGSEIYEFTGKFKELMGEPGKGFDVMIYGKPGNGKSTFALQLAEYIGERYADVLYVSSEQYDTASLKQNIAMNGIDTDYIFWTDALNRKDVSKYDFVVIDSINNLDLDIEAFKDLKNKNRNTSFILIFQVTKDGNFKGSQEWEHEVDMVVHVEKGVAEIEKNRFQGDELGRINVWNKKKK